MAWGDGPLMVIVAGPNGAGKSSFSHALKRKLDIIDPDAVARNGKLSPVAAGKVTLRLVRTLVQNRKSFIVETTLSGRTFFDILQKAKEAGFRLELHFVGLDNAELALARVRQRVALGGHDVPEQDLRRRFVRCLRNLPKALRLCDIGYLYDNSGRRSHQILAIVTRERMEIASTDLPYPPWFQSLLEENDTSRQH